MFIKTNKVTIRRKKLHQKKEVIDVIEVTET